MEFGCVAIMGLAFLAFAVLVFGIAAYQKNLNRANAQLSEAYYAYRGLLDALKQRPSDPNLRERTLQAGRYYSNLTRDKKGVTIFDEMALANDIAAACAGAAQQANPSGTTSGSAQIVEERLGRLKTLLASGAIDEQEYHERRGKLLDEV